LPGRSVIVASWLGNVVFACTAIPAALGVDAFDAPAVATALGLFFVSLGIWTWAFVLALGRSARGDDIVVANLFGTIGGASRPVRWHLFGSLTVCLLITVATAAADPFGVLVPMLPLGFVGLWAARYGTFPPRRPPTPRRA
jgi:cadmium resistance protein CadD (predicted permease)